LLQDGGYYPLGADRPRLCRARVIVATNRVVARAVADGSFRNDLYYRLRIHHFALPPLRARLDDLALLVTHFVEQAANTLGKPAPAVPPSLYTLLRTHLFPGNVRELEAMVFDAVARQKGSVLGLQSFREAIEATSPPVETAGGGGSAAPMDDLLRDRLPTLDEAQDALVTEALRRAEGNQGIAARMLGLSRQALNKRLARRRES
jgi:two-component system nitrogen regulation response regulator GlnG